MYASDSKITLVQSKCNEFQLQKTSARQQGNKAYFATGTWEQRKMVKYFWGTREQRKHRSPWETRDIIVNACLFIHVNTRFSISDNSHA
jgi:hypothetical protein